MFDAASFWAWVLTCPVATRDAGLAPITPWGSQRAFLQELLKGREEGVRQFFVHKGRQVGLSTAMLYWTAASLWQYPGLQGACVTESEDTRAYFRDQMLLITSQIPDLATPRVRNTYNLAWDNQSRLHYMVSGVRTGKRLGIGRGIAFGHGTEVARWTRADSLTYFRSSFSDVHPGACYVFESTAFGKNWWYDAWLDAQRGKTVRAMFVTFWLREDYQLLRGTPLFKEFWTRGLTDTEKLQARVLAKRYHRVLTPEQWAWRRWFLLEKAGGDEQLANQEMPVLPEDAFEASGAPFLAEASLRAVRQSVKAAPKAEAWRYEVGTNLEDMRLVRTLPGPADLSVWELPDPLAAYVVAAVPSWSTRGEDSHGIISVWRAEKDRLTQVAEYTRHDAGLQPFAWACAHLLGSYQTRNRTFILEVTGSGMGVLQELRQLVSTGWGTARPPKQLRDALGAIRHYLWRRPDSLTGLGALQWKSSGELQASLILRLRDQVARGSVEVRSPGMLDELEHLRQEGESVIPEGRAPRLHRVMAAALAVESWATQLQPLFRRMQGVSTAETVVGRSLETFFHNLKQGAAR